MASRRRRLSSIDRLPPAADDAVQWAMAELRRRAEVDVLPEFNERLAALGLGPISSSAFNRHSLRIRRAAARLEETRAIAAALSEKMPVQATDEVTVVTAEMLKATVMGMLEAHDEEGGALSPKEAMELSRALKHSLEAQAISTGRRAQIEKQIEARTEAAIKHVAAAKGMSAQSVDLFREAMGLKAGGG